MNLVSVTPSTVLCQPFETVQLFSSYSEDACDLGVLLGLRFIMFCVIFVGSDIIKVYR